MIINSKRNARHKKENHFFFFKKENMKEIPRIINRNSQIILVSHNHFAVFKALSVI